MPVRRALLSEPARAAFNAVSGQVIMVVSPQPGEGKGHDKHTE